MWHQMADLVARLSLISLNLLNTFPPSEKCSSFTLLLMEVFPRPPAYPPVSWGEGNACPTSQVSRTRQDAVRRFAVLGWKSHLAAISKVSSSFSLGNQDVAQPTVLGAQGYCAGVGFLGLPFSGMRCREWCIQTLLAKTLDVNMSSK